MQGATAAERQQFESQGFFTRERVFSRQEIAELRALAERQGIAFVDLLPTFEGLDERALQAHPVTDFHPNHLAHRRAAEALLEALAW